MKYEICVSDAYKGGAHSAVTSPEMLIKISEFFLQVIISIIGYTYTVNVVSYNVKILKVTYINSPYFFF